jgi:hypothetical protein
MIPVPGETPGQWWQATGAIGERESAALTVDVAVRPGARRLKSD